jgi:NarL family two-component system response regulator LiaR
MPMTQTRLLIVDDHVVIRKGLESMLGAESSICVVGEAEDGEEAIRKAKSLKPDVILMDLVMPGTDGVTAIAEIKRCVPDAKIIVLTSFEDDVRIDAAMGAGADGYLLKDVGRHALAQAIRTVRQGDLPLAPHVARRLVRSTVKSRNATGHNPLTKREEEVLRMVARGLTNRAVAEALNIGEGTVKVHMANILHKLNVSSRTGAVVLAIQTGLVPPKEGS